MTIGQKIKSLRKQQHMTQTELGDRLGVKKNAVSKWETGRVEDIPASKIKAMAALFDVPPSYLIDNDAAFLAPASAVKAVPSDEEIKFALFGGDGEITDEMYREVLMFASFVKEREARKKE